MIRGAAGRHPGGLPVGLTRDTRRNRRVPGETYSRDTWRFRRLPVKSHSLDSRRTRGLPGGSYWFGVLGTRGVLARHPKDSLGEALGVGFSGTRGSLELLPDVPSRLKHSGTRGSLGTLPGILSRSTTRGTWHVSKAFGEMASGLASGTGGTFRRMVRQGFQRRLRREAFGRASGWFRKGLSVGFGDTCHLPKGLRKVFWAGLSRKGFRRKLRRVVFRNDFHHWIRNQRLGFLR